MHCAEFVHEILGGSHAVFPESVLQEEHFFEKVSINLGSLDIKPHQTCFYY